MMIKTQKKSRLIFIGLLFSLTVFGCSSPAFIQPQVNSLVVSGKHDLALNLLRNNENSYGERSRLLYLLDYALTAHYSKKYQESVTYFAAAKKLYDQLYTVSVTGEFVTWLVNDNTSPYRGEDFERAMINVFQALNFIALNQFDDALVEMRDVDSVLKAINLQYDKNQKNVYVEDAFIRLISGIIYEWSDHKYGLSDALTAYKLSFDIYGQQGRYYNLVAPRILKQNLLSLTEIIKPAEYSTLAAEYPNVSYVHQSEKSKKAEVIVLDYSGFAPIKHEVAVPVPLPRGKIAKIAFPSYSKRKTYDESIQCSAVKSDGTSVFGDMETVEDIGAIAMKNLEQRKLRVIAKAALRSAGKAVITSAQEQMIRDKWGDRSAQIFRQLSNIYNFTSERADLRSWVTLPDKIKMGRLLLEPGNYRINVDDVEIAQFELNAGDREILLFRRKR